MFLTLPAGFRIAFGGIALIIFATMLFLAETSTLGFVIAVICALAALYDEKWSFDRAESLVRHRIGLIKVSKTTSFALGDLEEFALIGYKPEPEPSSGFMQRRMATSGLVCFAFRSTDSGQHTIELRKNKDNQTLLENARRIADFCGKPLRSD